MTTMTPPATTATAPIDARAATLRQAAADKHDLLEYLKKL